MAYQAFPEEACPNMPFITFEEIESNNFSADGKVYFKISEIEITLFSKKRDTASESLIETALSNNSLFWQKSFEPVDDENCLMTIYTIQI